jgi:membrane protease YdiL (CAAX protease family)
VPPPDTASRELPTALALWLGLGLLLTLLALAGASLPWLAPHVLALSALAFLQAPRLLAPAPPHPDPDRAWGWTFQRWPRSLAILALTCLATLAFYLPAGHLWRTTVQGQTFDWQPGTTRRPPPLWQGTAPDPPAGTAWILSDEGGWLALRPGTDPPPLAWRLHAPGALHDTLGRQQTTWDLAPHQARWLRSAGAREACLQTLPPGQTLPPDAVRTGPDLRPLAPTRCPDGHPGFRIPWHHHWLLWSMLVQILLIALPEEFFYRGYLLDVLQRRWPGVLLRLGPLSLTRANVATAILFALGHLFTVLSWHRLAVFFPSLLFGVLRERTGSLLAPVLFHAFCNVLVEVMALAYMVRP